MDFKFQRTRIDKIPESRIFDELEKAAKHFKYIEFGRRDFARFANISDNVVMRHFGTWKKGLEALRSRLKEKGMDLRVRPHAPQQVHSDKELFNEMELVWQKAGQRPSRIQWQALKPRVSYQTYARRFGSWTNACLKFIEYKMGSAIFSDDEIISHEVAKNTQKKVIYKAEDSRTIPLRVRLKVLDRDNFRCIFCGRSPATDVGVRLHIDHKIPFSKGGKSIVDNLQTLCYDCNLGKGNGFVKA